MEGYLTTADNIIRARGSKIQLIVLLVFLFCSVDRCRECLDLVLNLLLHVIALSASSFFFFNIFVFFPHMH